MRVTHPNWQHRLLVVGLAWLLILFVVGVIAANHPSLDEVPVQLQAQSGAEVDASGRVLVLPGDSSGEALATLRFVLPAPDPASSRWVVWMGRDPVESRKKEQPCIPQCERVQS